MSKVVFHPKGVCSREITFDIEGNIIRNIEFKNGCNGNAQGIASLAEGMTAEELIKKLSGIKCGFKSTSCPDQLAQALKKEISNK